MTLDNWEIGYRQRPNYKWQVVIVESDIVRYSGQLIDSWKDAQAAAIELHSLMPNLKYVDRIYNN